MVGVGGWIEFDPGQVGEVALDLQGAVVVEVDVAVLAGELEGGQIAVVYPICADDLSMVAVAGVVFEQIALGFGEDVVGEWVVLGEGGGGCSENEGGCV